MKHYSIFLPSYTIGTDAYEEMGVICRPYGTQAVVIGGKRAMEAAREELTAAAAKGAIQILEFVWFGGECSFKNVEALENNPKVREAELLFAVGGGKATDTVKALGEKTGKPVFAFPTIASNCSPCTSVSIMYNEDGSFLKPWFFRKPPAHTFIHLGIISRAPKIYMWAGIGDTYAKYFEATVSSRGERLSHYVGLGVTISSMCLTPLLEYGAQALRDNEQQKVSPALEQTVLAIIATTALTSILVTQDRIIDYNTGLAHAIYYAFTSFPPIEKDPLHGEVVGYGTLILLLADGQKDMFEKLYRFNRETGLPASLKDMGITREELPQIIEKTLAMKDIDHNPYPITREMLQQAFEELERRE